MSEVSRSDRYRDLLETWVKWWCGPAKNYGLHDQLPIIPPVTASMDALRCSICQGIGNEPGRCAVCGRDLTGRW